MGLSIEMAQRLSAYRRHLGLSQDELAERMGVSREAISQWERAESTPDVDNLVLMAKICGVTMDELLCADPAGEPSNMAAEMSGGNGMAQESVEMPFEWRLEHARAQRRWSLLNKCYPFICAVAFGLFGAMDLFGGWATSWMVFLTIPLYYTLRPALKHRKPSQFAFPVLVTLVYLWLGMRVGIWHPSWLLFLTIPPYYIFASEWEKHGAC